MTNNEHWTKIRHENMIYDGINGAVALTHENSLSGSFLFCYIVKFQLFYKLF